MACSLRYYADRISFQLSLASHSDSESFLVVHALLSQGGCQRKEFWEVVGRFPNSSGWWWLISSMFLTRTSYCKITHTGGCNGAWPWSAILVNVSPNKSSKPEALICPFAENYSVSHPASIQGERVQCWNSPPKPSSVLTSLTPPFDSHLGMRGAEFTDLESQVPF